ncbi:MAG: hypothetical protein K0Q79_2752 [Flavipsychrobacter sp.]|jgi:hypothetical protein|nr:hypothetical protein [Flavipsychrobacter sp.]
MANQNQRNSGAVADKKHLNEGLGLEQFNYAEMKGEMYNKYLDLVEGKVIDPDDPHQRRAGGLNANKQYVFEMWNVKPIEKRLFPKSRVDNTMVPNGFELRENKPRTVTTTYLKDVLLLNRALYAKIAGDNNNPIFYYVLQIPKSEK